MSLYNIIPATWQVVTAILWWYDVFFHVVDLLLHFFKFYSEWKSSLEVVAIHCPLERTLSPSDAISLATAPQERSYGDLRPFKCPSLIIQDPFELTHNLCKTLSKANFVEFQRRLRIAAELLETKNNLLPLFDRREYEERWQHTHAHTRTHTALKI